MKSINTIILLGITAASWNVPVHADSEQHNWRPYVCKMMEWPVCMTGKKRIYPTTDTYVSKDACLEDFEQKFEEDPEISSKYPQSEAMETSYAFYCEDRENPVDKQQMESMKQRAEKLKQLTEDYEKQQSM